MSSVGVASSPKRRVSTQSVHKQQTLAEAFSNSQKRARTESPMLIDLTKSPASPPGKLIGGQRSNVRKLTIKNFSLKDTSAREAEYYENTFRKLNDALDLILTGKRLHGLQDLYKGCETVVRGGHAARCAKLATSKMTSHMKTRRAIVCREIQSGGSAVQLVTQEWKSWKNQISVIHSILFYLDRTYLLSTTNEVPVIETGTSLFRHEIVLPQEIKESFISGVNDIFNESRAMKTGNVSDGQLLSDVMQMLGTVKLYDSLFEPYFLRSTEDYFKNENDNTSHLSVYEVLELISMRLATELARSDQYLRTVTRSATNSIVKQKLIKGKAQHIVAAFAKVLEARDHAKLKQMYEYLTMVDESERLRHAFASCIKSTGLQILADKANDKTMVESLLTFKEEMDEVLKKSFASEDLFSKALRDQFSAFINSRGDVPAEMMAKFIDSVLRSGNKKFDENDLEIQMARLMDIFRFIASKDVFEAFYKKDLAKRLLLNKSASADAERSLLAKLKVECGAGFTHKLEGMFKDVDISRDYAKNFTNKSLEVFVLSQGSWPTYPEVKARIPEQMTAALQEFQDYYLKANNGRKLMWRHSLGHCQIRASFPKGEKDLMVSLFQGIVILSFNGEADTLTYRDIQASTGLEDKELIRTLQSLACGKPETRVLLKTPKGKDVNPDDIFRINDNFQNPKRIVKINQIQMKETAEENKATHDRVIQDRSFEIQAAIIRIMKSAKKKSHSELIAATIDTIKGRGVPSVTAIKQAIEKLLDREYLSRHDSAYVYEA